jgi:ATP-dependent DNA helicase DinG
VDLETTGLSSDPDAEILELGLVLLDPGATRIATHDGLVRPSRPLPRPVQRLTGLCDADVLAAPRLEEVVSGVARNLAGRVIIAHNAEFERHFLARYVDASLGRATYLDTQDLLAITHPDAPDLRLESFTRALLGTEERHRALEDALDTARVLSRVASGAASAERRFGAARSALETYAPESPWLGLLGKGLAVLPREEPSQFVAIETSDESRVPFEEDAIAAALADAERGARYFPGYRVRKEQIEMARQFVRNLAEGGALLLEGGTGVGKSLAYLAAAIPFAVEQRECERGAPVLISTRTKLLQDQLLSKDIAAAARFLGYPDLLALSIKGRANYVCARRLEGVLGEGREPSIFPQDRLAYAALMACARTRTHGEVGALPAAFVRRFPAFRDLLRRSVAARAEQCTREQCAAERGCPFGRRRAALSGAHLIVANHDLLLRWPPDYPEFTHAIVDEAHELAGVADEVYALEVRPEQLVDRIDEIFGRPTERGRADGLLPRPKRRATERDIAAWRRAIHRDLVSLGRSFADRASEFGEVQLPAHADRAFSEEHELAERVADRLAEVAGAADALAGAKGRDDGPAAVERATAELREAATGLRAAFADTADSVAAFEGVAAPYDRWRLVIRSVSPADAFRERFLARLESFAAVSASLFVGGDPFAALGELEIDARSGLRVTQISVESPFPYAEHMRVLALDEAPRDPVEATATVLADLARELGGRTLGLFTSLRRMNQVAELLSERLRGEGFDILAPRSARDDPAALVERFRRSDGAGVLLGARSFWQGLDIPGPELQAVVIEKLPFEVPTELRKRREARVRAAGEDAFGRYVLGKMLLYLKQMVGRLIRSEEDRGVVVIVDGRTQQRYFRRLSEALPPGAVVDLASRADLPARLAEVGIGGDSAPSRERG